VIYIGIEIMHAHLKS